MNPVSRRQLMLSLPLAAAAMPLRALMPPTALTADFDPAAALWLSYDEGHAALCKGLVAALAPHVALKCLVPDAARLEAARAALPASGVEFFVDAQAGFYLRDAAVFARGSGSLGLVDFRASQYGAAVWCARRYQDVAARAHCDVHARVRSAERAGIAGFLGERLGAAVFRSLLALEGGGVEVNGRGVMIANVALHATRNPSLSRARIDRELLRLPGMRKVIWLPDGLAEDVHLRGTITGPYVAWGTGGHTDEFVRFADENTVLLAWPDDDDAQAHPVSRLTRERMQRNHQILARATDARGRRLRVIKVPMPRPVQRRVVLDAEADALDPAQWRPDFFPAAEKRIAGQALWQVATASWLNFVVANDAVVLPDYRDHGTPGERQESVRRLFESVFAGRKLYFVDALSANWAGGGLHCATLNQPRIT